MKRALALSATCVVLTAMGSLAGGQASAARPDSGQGSGQGARHGGPGRHLTLPGGYKHLVVIYQENHSFDNLYGSWGSVMVSTSRGWPTLQ